MKKNMNTNEPLDLDKIIMMIPLGKAGICVNCDRVFTILNNQSKCPGCQSTAWHPLGPWMNQALSVKGAA